MIKTEKKLEEVEVVADIICDICGASCKTEYGNEYLSLTTSWGYMSNKDLETWKAQICEKCVDEHFKIVKFQKIDSFTGRKI